MTSNETYAEILSAAGRRMAEVADQLTAAGTDPDSDAPPARAAALVHYALDSVDEAVEILAGDLEADDR